MARPRDDDAARELGRNLTALWERQGRPAFRSIERALENVFGPGQAPSNETIRKMHHGEVNPRTASIEALAGLADYYGVPARDLGDAVAGRLGLLVEMAQNWK